MLILGASDWSVAIECIPCEWSAIPTHEHKHTLKEVWELISMYEEGETDWTICLTFLNGSVKKGPLIQICLAGEECRLFPKDHHTEWKFDKTFDSFVGSLVKALSSTQWTTFKPRELLAGLGVAIKLEKV